MTIEEKAAAFKDIIMEYTNGKPVIIKKDIQKVIGITMNEVSIAIKDVTYFGKKTHFYFVDEVATALAIYMVENKEQQDQSINSNRQKHIEKYKSNVADAKKKIKAKDHKKISNALKAEETENVEFLNKNICNIKTIDDENLETKGFVSRAPKAIQEEIAYDINKHKDEERHYWEII